MVVAMVTSQQNSHEEGRSELVLMGACNGDDLLHVHPRCTPASPAAMRSRHGVDIDASSHVKYEISVFLNLHIMFHTCLD